MLSQGRRPPLVAGRSLLDYAEELAAGAPGSCRRSGRCHECVVEIRRGAEMLSPATEAESFLRHGYRLACQAVVVRDADTIEFEPVRRHLRILMPPEARPADLDPAVTVEAGRVCCDGQDLGPAGEHVLGLAIDVGTTTIVLELVDLRTAETIGTAAFENPQRFGGSDVMGRVAYDAWRPGELRQALRRALNTELWRLYREVEVARSEVYEAIVVGNTTMRDMFFGLDVQPLGRQPFRSVSELAWRRGEATTTAISRPAHELGLLLHPRARVQSAPLVACHVGADAAADLVAASFEGSPATTMVMDVGTNTEVILTDGARILATSSPAGPAFEGGLVRHGMPAAVGAIERVRRVDGRFKCSTIGDVEPEGICGSGLIDLLAEMLRSGCMSPLGVFGDGAPEVSVVPAFGISLSRADVSHLAQAKAANAVAQQVLLRTLGKTALDVDRLALAGGFAIAIDIGNAVEIGFLAPVPADRVEKLGNAAVRGARELLLSRSRREALDRLVGRIEHVELEAEPDFFELFVDACRYARLAI